MIAVLGGLGAAAMWAITTLCASRSSRMIGAGSAVAWVMLVGLAITGPLAAAQGIPSELDGGTAGWLLLAGGGNVGGLLLAYAGFRTGKVSIVAPIASTEGAIAAVIAIVAGESIAPGVGVMLAVIGVGVSLAATPHDADAAAAGAPASRAALFAGAAALAFGSSLYATGRVSDELPIIWVVLAGRLVGAVAVALPLALAGRLRLTRRALPLVAASGVCEVLGFASYALGARHGIAVAAVFASQFAALSAVGAYVLFGERLARVQVTGGVMIVVGATVLSGLKA